MLNQTLSALTMAGLLLAAIIPSIPQSAAAQSAPIEHRSLTAFDRVEVSGNLRVEITVGGAPTVDLIGPRSATSQVQTIVAGDKLEIRPRPNARLAANEVLVRVRVPVLRALETLGSSQVVARNIRNDAFDLTVSGSGDVTLEGRADMLRLESHGSASVHAGSLVVREAQVDAAGSGHFQLHVEHTLRGVLMGSAVMQLGGNPRVRDLSVLGSDRVEG